MQDEVRHVQQNVPSVFEYNMFGVLGVKNNMKVALGGLLAWGRIPSEIQWH